MKIFEITDALCARLGVSPVSALSPDGHGNDSDFVPPPKPIPSGYDPALADRDPLFQAMARLGLVIGGPRRTDMGWTFDLICPWVHEHTLRATTGTAYAPGVERFKCQHGHCIDRTPGDLKPRLDEMLRADSHGLVGLAQIAGEVEFDVVDPASVPLPDTLKRWDGAFFARYVWLGPKDGFWDQDAQVLVHDRTLNSVWTGRLGKSLPLVGEGKRRHPMPPATWFLRDRRGQHVDGLIYWPNQPDIVSHNNQTLANRWRPLARPLRGATVGDTEVQPWLDLYWHVIGQDTLEAWAMGEMILDWLAMVLASSVKGGWQVLVIGTQGIGKDMIVAPLMKALGDRMAQVLSAIDVTSPWNEWMSRRLVLFSEIRQTTRGTLTPHDQMARLKTAFDPGKEWVPINPKMLPQTVAWNVLMGWLTSNEAAPLRLEEGDRRFLVLDRRCVVRWGNDAYDRLGHWYAQENGFALVAEWLFHRWETMPVHRQRALTGVAPMTEAKALMIEENEDPIDAWLRDAVESEHPDPEALPDVVSVEFVIQRLLQAQQSGRFNGMRVNTNTTSVGHRLAKAGAVKLNDGVQVRVQGRRVRAWAVRNTALYSLLNPADIAKVCNVIGLTGQSLSLI